MQVEARCQLAEEQAEKKEQELRSRVTSLEEATLQSENQVKELKETIFELEDQVEQHRAVNCHTNQAVLDMESMSLPVWCIVGNKSLSPKAPYWLLVSDTGQFIPVGVSVYFVLGVTLLN